MTVIIFIIVLFSIVLIHEYGHFIVAKRNNIRVDEFGIGFPPKAISLGKRGETEFTLNWLPLGGFVKIFGESAENIDPNSPDAKRSLTYASKWTQAKVVFAGPLFNLLLAWLLFMITFMIGTFVSPDDAKYNQYIRETNTRITYVSPEGPAEQAGLASGDILTSIKGKNGVTTVTDAEDVKEALANLSKEPIVLTVEQGKVQKEISVTPTQGVLEDPSQYGLGIGYETLGEARLPIHKAFIEGAIHTWEVSKQLVVFVVDLISKSIQGEAPKDALTGPIGVAKIVGGAAEISFSYLLTIAAFISINLGIINLIPFPALDGGRLFILGLEAITQKRFTQKTVAIIHNIGFVILIGLMVLITYKDIIRFF